LALNLLNGAWLSIPDQVRPPRGRLKLDSKAARPIGSRAFTIAVIGAELPESLIIVGLFYL